MPSETPAVGSALDEIQGIGAARRTALLKHFKSIKAIKDASFEDLQKVVPKNAALAVYVWAHTSEPSGDYTGFVQAA